MTKTFHSAAMRLLVCLVLVSLVLAPQAGAPAQAARPPVSTYAPAAAGDTVHTLILAPQSPNILQTNQDVTINFSYSTTNAAGVRIFIRPYTDGKFTPYYSASGSGVYPQSATGSGSATFRLTDVSGGQEIVDQLKITMYNPDQTVLLFEAFVPVYYLFSSAPDMVFNITFLPPQGGAGNDTPNLLPLSENVDFTFNYITGEKNGVRIFGRPISNGNLTPSYSANGSALYTGSGSASGYFTISTTQAPVDQIRFQVWNSGQTALLFEAFLPVYFRFRTALNNVTHIHISPDTPNSLQYGQNVTVSFDYAVAGRTGAYIFVRPFSGVQLAPGYAACGSPVYTGTGTASCAISLTSGPTLVDKLRVQMWNTAQTILLYEAFLPVGLLWSGAAPPPGPDMAVDAIEVTQAIQDLNNNVDLVAGKQTFVRVHVSSPTQVANITATLKGKHGAVTLAPILTPSNAGGTINVKSNPDRSQLNDSFWFQIPADWTTTGSLTLIARLDPNNKTNDPTLANNTKFTSVSFLASAPLRLKIMNVQYTASGVTYSATATDMNALESWLRRAYPIPSLIVSRQTFVYPKSGLPNVDTLNSYLALSKLLSMILSGEDSRVVYYGMVADGGGFMRGKAAGIPGTVAAGPTGVPSGNFSWDSDASYGDWYGGHEIGHTRNRYHAMFCGAADGAVYPYPNGRISPVLTGDGTIYGFDIATHAIYGPTWTDVMTYCANEWMSDFTYEGIRTYLTDLGLSPISRAPAAVTASDFIAVSGMANLSDNSASLNDVYKITQTNTLPLPVTGPDWSIVLKGSGGSVLATYMFVPGELTDPDAGAGIPALIAEVVPWTIGTTSIEIQYKGAMKAERAVSGHAPTVSLTAPTGGTLTEGAFTVSWTGSDVDLDTLTYSLLYSADGGTTWEALANGLSESSIDLNTAQLPGGSILLRVVASDGFLTAQSTSGSITVPAHAPTASIQSPAPGSVFLSNQPVSLQGSGYDSEDGTLDGSTFEWSSSLDGALGTGADLNTSDLTPGTHTITLKVTDSSALTGEAVRTVTILTQYHTLFLPNMQR